MGMGNKSPDENCGVCISICLLYAKSSQAKLLWVGKLYTAGSQFAKHQENGFAQFRIIPVHGVIQIGHYALGRRALQIGQCSQAFLFVFAF